MNTYVIVWIGKSGDEIVEVVHNSILELLHLLLLLLAQIPPLFRVLLQIHTHTICLDWHYRIRIGLFVCGSGSCLQNKNTWVQKFCLTYHAYLLYYAYIHRISLPDIA